MEAAAAVPQSGAAGSDAPVCSERDIAPSFSCPDVHGDVPVRLLDEFVCTQDGELRGLDALESKASRVTLCVFGILRPPDAGGEPMAGGVRVRLDAVTDYVVDYVRRGICLVTAHGWYRLLRPAPSYAPLFQHTRRKCVLAARAAAALDADPMAYYDAVVQGVLEPPPPSQGAELAAAQGRDAGTRFSELSLLAEARFLVAQLSEAVPLAREALTRPASFLGHLAEQCGGLPRQRPPPFSYAQTLPFDPENDEGVIAARSAALLARMDWRLGRGVKRARTARRRGDPPPARTDFGFEPALVGRVLQLWDAFSSFRVFLRLPPVPLCRLVAALCPDSSFALTGAEAGAASGALLRDLHTALLRIVAGRDVALQPEAPAVARADGGPSGAPWTEAARVAVARAPAWLVGEAGTSAACALQDGDYADLPAADRVALCAALLELALDRDAFRDHAELRVEDADEDADAALPWEHGDAAAAVDAARPWEAWSEWALRVAPAPGRPLAEDLEGRRYWVLGGAAGWGRLFVEEATTQEAASWACYSWEQLPAVAAWLEAGGLKSASERVLLRALRRLPQMPTASLTLTPCSARVQSAPEGGGISAEGPDGYAGLVAPLLRGGGTGDASAAGVEPQVRACVQALLAAIPFWTLGQEMVSRFRLLHAAGAALGSGLALGATLHELEALMHAAGALRPEWAHRRAAWRLDAARCRTLASAALPVALLQEHLLRDPDLLTREAFQRLARSSQLLLPFLPALGQTVVLARTGMRRLCESQGVQCDPALWAALRPAERFRTECLAFQRGDAAAAGLRSLHTCWLLLTPADDALAHLGGGFCGGLCVPVPVASGAHDHVLDADVYERSLQRVWSAGDRFRHFFPSPGPEILPGRKPGSWFKGTIVRVWLHVEVSAGGAGDGGRYVDVDPWQAYEVTWDSENRRRDSTCAWLPPWMLEAPEGLERAQAQERSRREEEQRRLAAAAAHAAALQRSQARSMASFGASRPVTPPASAAVFMSGLAAFFVDNSRTLRIPTFCHAPLDVYRVFCEVQARGGYNAVTAAKRWREVCVALEVDLSVVTGASFALRNHYERVLIAYERHLAGELPQPDGGMPANDTGLPSENDSDSEFEPGGDDSEDA